MSEGHEHGFLESAAAGIGRAAGTAVGAMHAERASHPVEKPIRHGDIRFEKSDLNAKGTFLIGAGVLVGMWIITGLLYFLFAGLAHYRAAVSPPPLPAELKQDKLPAEPRLQGRPRLDLKAFQQHEDWELTHYHWIDKQGGVAAIPIEDAIRITAQRGIPASSNAPNPSLTPPGEGERETGFEPR